VVVGSDGQFVPTFGAAAFEHLTPLGSRHPGAEAVHTDAAANLGLVCTFWHCKSSLYEKDDNKWKLNIIRHFSGGTLL
jgi:hypothetical protein